MMIKGGPKSGQRQSPARAMPAVRKPSRTISCFSKTSMPTEWSQEPLMRVPGSCHASPATHCLWPASSCCDGGDTAPAEETATAPFSAPSFAAPPLAAASAAALSPLRRLLPPAAAVPSARAASASSRTAAPGVPHTKRSCRPAGSSTVFVPLCSHWLHVLPAPQGHPCKFSYQGLLCPFEHGPHQTKVQRQQNSACTPNSTVASCLWQTDRHQP